MGYCRFLSALVNEGRVTVSQSAPISEEELRAGDELLVQFERVYRLEMPADPPVLNIAAARWGATRFFRACQFAVYRDHGAEVLDQELGQPYSGPAGPEAHYSVDLTLRFLPDLAKFSVATAEQDPLNVHLRRWARDWPLSSIGMSGLDDSVIVIDGIADSASLMQLYVDRVIAAGDTARLADARVRSLAARAVGMFPDLAPSIRKTLAVDATEAINA